MNNQRSLTNIFLLLLVQHSLLVCMEQKSHEVISYEYKDELKTLKDLAINKLIKEIIARKIIPPKDVEKKIKYTQDTLYDNFANGLHKIPGDLHAAVWQKVFSVPLNSQRIGLRKIFALNKEHSLAVISSEKQKETGNLCEWPSLKSKCKLNATSAVFCENSNQLAFTTKEKAVLNTINTADTQYSVHKLALAESSPVETALFPHNKFILLKHTGKNNIYTWNSKLTGAKWANFNHYCGMAIEAIGHYPGYIYYGEKLKGDHCITVINLETFKKHLTLSKFEDTITCLAYASGLVVGSSDDKTVRAWDVFNTQKCTHILHHPHAVNTVALSPLGTYLASGTKMPHGKVSIWDMRMNKPFHSVQLNSTPSPFLKSQNPNAHPSITVLSFNPASTELIVEVADAHNPQIFKIELAGNLKLLKIEADNFFTKPRED